MLFRSWSGVDVSQQPQQVGWAHVAFSLGSREAVDKLAQTLADAGFTVSPPRVTATRVVQILPGPIPTFTVFTPALASSSAARAVTILPATRSMSENLSRILRTASITLRLCPCAESTVITSTPAFIRASTRRIVSSPTPTAAPHRRCPCWSLQAFGWLPILSISLLVMSPTSLY